MLHDSMDPASTAKSKIPQNKNLFFFNQWASLTYLLKEC